MERRRDESSEGLLPMNGNAHVENNNMGEKEFHSLDLDINEDKKQGNNLARVCTPRKFAIITTIFVATAVIVSAGTILYFHIKGKFFCH